MSNSQTISRPEVEDFLYHEAELLDNWDLLDWKDLYTEDSVYEITSTDSEDPWNDRPETSLFLLADKKNRIEARAIRLMKRAAHCEYPHSRTRHLYTNVRVVSGENGETHVKANFLVYRNGNEKTTHFMGEMRYTLVSESESSESAAIKIKSKRLVLDLLSLNDAGQMTIIL